MKTIDIENCFIAQIRNQDQPELVDFLANEPIYLTKQQFSTDNQQKKSYFETTNKSLALLNQNKICMAVLTLSAPKNKIDAWIIEVLAFSKAYQTAENQKQMFQAFVEMLAQHHLAALKIKDDNQCHPALWAQMKFAKNHQNQAVYLILKPHKKALVLGGGGAKGSYQIGVWKAFIELNEQFKIVVGTSVGALNGGLIVQGDYELAQKMWQDIDTSHILDFKTNIDGTTIEGYQELLKKFTFQALKDKGLRTEPLKNILEELLDEVKMRGAGIEFGLTTTSLPKFEKVKKFLTEIPYGQVAAYLLASSSFFPMMQPAKIDGQYFMDGGYHDNVPVDLALEKEATELVIVDVKGLGMTPKMLIPDYVLTKTIISKWNLGALLFFDGTRSKQNMALGYLETMKAYGKYMGNWYTFETNDFQAHQTKMYRQFSHFMASLKEDFPILYTTISGSGIKLLRSLQQDWGDRITKDELVYALQEIAGKIFELSPTQVYSFEAFDQLLSQAKEDKVAEQTSNSLKGVYAGEEFLNALLTKLPTMSDRKVIALCLALLTEKTQIKNQQTLQQLIKRRPKLFSVALYLYLIA
ncbi:patatin-like phospholipase family protein [Isobaculum melis]|uniref:NTE family protein n=1 Tax=Isobaculum melis TaxID=142588 RepID=A0A1H9RA57_9LACT|nr:patatin-like phospholipase family protein [Isobaculum melis]SER69435.1 NTE family protein [Isobaculum melis]